MVATQAGLELESFEYHEQSDTYRIRYDRDRVPTSMAVIAALSKVMDRDPIELEPLHTFIDADALDEVVCVPYSSDGDVSVSFNIQEHTITVANRSLITISPPRRDRTAGRKEAPLSR